MHAGTQQAHNGSCHDLEKPWLLCSCRHIQTGEISWPYMAYMSVETWHSSFVRPFQEKNNGGADC